MIDFETVQSDATGAIVSCRRESARRLIRRLGTSYKIAQIFSDSDIDQALIELELPYAEKFGWTVSGYNTAISDIEEAKDELRDLLKEKDMRRTKFVDPLEESVDEERKTSTDNEEGRFQFKEVKASDLLSRVFGIEPEKRTRKTDKPLEGIDFIVHGGIGNSGPFYASTIGVSDILGFQKRDFERPYQDPTITMSPRIARAVVNMAAFKSRGSLLDPFCGLGTILQEALVLGYSAIGIDKNTDVVMRAKTNLKWTIDQFPDSGKRFNVIRMDARRISELTLQPMDFIASEPIILPAFEKNPSPKEADFLLSESVAVYESAFANLKPLLSSAESRIALTTPVIIDSRGRAHTTPIIEAARKSGFVEFWPKSLRNRSPYPIRVETAKKKIVHRELSLFSLS